MESTRPRKCLLTLQVPQEQPVPAQELEQQLVQELSRGTRGQQRFVADREAWTVSFTTAVPHELVIQVCTNRTAHHVGGLLTRETC